MRDFMFTKVILPVFGNEDNSFMGITTLDGGQNWVTEFKLIRDKKGNLIVQSLHHGPCESCTERGEANACPHYERMPWKSKSKEDVIKEIYAQRGEAALGMQEMMGATISPLTFIIRPAYITQLKERPLYIFERTPSVIYVAIDPHGGGKTSRTCIMFLANENGRIVVSPPPFTMNSRDSACLPRDPLC